MAKTSIVQKQQRKPKFKVRAYTRCGACGRQRAVYQKIQLVPHLFQKQSTQR